MIQILSDQELRAKLTDLSKQGFTQIKLPGGTSKNGEHYSGVVVPKYVKENKTTYFQGLPYNPQFHKSNEENGNSKKEGESPEQTAAREVMEEVGIIIKVEDLVELTSSKKVLSGKIVGTTHTKNFFLAKKFSGTSFIFDGPNAIDKETAAPIWFPASFFKQVLWVGHQPAFEEGCQILMATDRDICMSIWDLYPNE